jgi:chromosome segregation ATPase
MTKRSTHIDNLKQKALAPGANTAAINSQVEKAEANQEKARDKVAKYEVKIDNETYKCEAKPAATPEIREEIVEKIIEK